MMRRVRLGLDVLRALEHHVLEQVREAGAARPLVLRADVVPDRHVHDRRRVILGEDHPQPVRQRRDLVLELGRTDRGLQRRRSATAASDGQPGNADDSARRSRIVGSIIAC